MDRIIIVSETERITKEVEKFFSFTGSFSEGEGISTYLNGVISTRDLSEIQHCIRNGMPTKYDREKCFMYIYVKHLKNSNVLSDFSEVYKNMNFAKFAENCRTHDGDFSFIDSLIAYYKENDKTEKLKAFDNFIFEMYKVKVILGKNKSENWPKSILDILDWNKSIVPESKIKQRYIESVNIAV